MLMKYSLLYFVAKDFNILYYNKLNRWKLIYLKSILVMVEECGRTGI